MRLGEIRNILEDALGDGNLIVIQNEPVFGGQGQRVSNYKEVITALDTLSTQDWNSHDYSQIEAIKEKHDSSLVTILDADEFNQLSSYVNAINSQIPLFYSFVNSFVEDQDEKTLNIKLPGDVETLKELSDVNKRLDDIFKLFNIDCEFRLEGFDRGSEWYVLVSAGYLSYKYALGCLKVAQEFLKTRTEYFKSEEARIHYETAVEEKDRNEGSYEQYQEGYLEKLVDKKISALVEHINETNGKEKPEIHSQLVIATTKLIKELGKGTEFHLSLNPPAYASEKGGILEIDYKSLYVPKALEEVEPQQLPEGSSSGEPS